MTDSLFLMKIGITGSSGMIGSRFIKKYGNIYDLIEFSGDMTNFEDVNAFMKSNFDLIYLLNFEIFSFLSLEFL